MDNLDVLLAESGSDQPTTGSSVKLSEEDLDRVVGGLARPWTEADPDAWRLEPAKSVL